MNKIRNYFHGRFDVVVRHPYRVIYRTVKPFGGDLNFKDVRPVPILIGRLRGAYRKIKYEAEYSETGNGKRFYQHVYRHVMSTESVLHDNITTR